MDLLAECPNDEVAVDRLFGNDEWRLGWWALLVLINRPWFARMWILQEFALAREILICCGSKISNWDSLLLIVNGLWENSLLGNMARAWKVLLNSLLAVC